MANLEAYARWITSNRELVKYKDTVACCLPLDSARSIGPGTGKYLDPRALFWRSSLVHRATWISAKLQLGEIMAN